MKYLLPFLIYFILVCSAFSSNCDLVKNFASTILGKNDLSIALIELKSIPIHSKDLTLEQRLRISDPNWLEFLNKQYPISTEIRVNVSYCKKISSKMIFLKRYATGLNSYREIGPVLIFENSIWLVLLDSMYDYESNLKFDLNNEEVLYRNLDKYPFINASNFYKIALPQRDNAICIKWQGYSNLTEIPNNIIKSSYELLYDIKMLTELFCDKKENIFTTGNLDLITKTIPQLKSKEGKKIAEAMVSIIEDEIIKVEFPENVKKSVEKAKNSIPKLDFDAVEKEYNKN